MVGMGGLLYVLTTNFDYIIKDSILQGVLFNIYI